MGVCAVSMGCVGVVKAVSRWRREREKETESESESKRASKSTRGETDRWKERAREGMSLELSCRRMRALRLAAEGEARQRLLIHQDPPTNSR